MHRFANQIALVTGGAAGIGRAAVDRIIAEGGKVVVWDINADKLADCQRVHGDRALCQRVDVTDEKAIGDATEKAILRFHRINILVNGAGIVGPNKPFWDITSSEWVRVIDVNLTSMFLVSRAVHTHIPSDGSGRIINIASVTAKEGPQNLSAYAASKAAIVALTKSMAKDLIKRKISVNAIAPALIATEILAQLTPEYYAAALSRIPMGRPGTLEEAAALITWLCSSECSFSTGAVYDLSGGRGV